MRDPTHDRNARGQVQLVDTVLGFLTLVGLIVLAPFIYKFANMAADSADPFSALLLRLIPGFLFIALIISVGVSARRGGP